MKLIRNFLFVLLILIISCNPLSQEQNTLRKGNYSGTFAITFKKSSITKSGDISIQFEDSTYKYFAIVNYSSDTTVYDSLSDCGSYSLSRGKLEMVDISWFLMRPGPANSLYFEDTYSINSIYNQLQISQDNSYAKCLLNLIYK